MDEKKLIRTTQLRRGFLKRQSECVAALLLLCCVPTLALADQLQGISDAFALIGKFILAFLGTLFCFVKLLVSLIRPEKPDTPAGNSDAASAVARPWVASGSIWRAILYATPCCAAALYVAHYSSPPTGGTGYLFYGKLGLAMVVIVALVWLFKRPNGAIGIGISGVLALFFQIGTVQDWREVPASAPQLTPEEVRQVPFGAADTRLLNMLPDSIKPYTYIGQMPAFAGGPDSLRQAIRRQLRYPSQALRSQVQGTVVLRGIVAPDGRLVAAAVAKGLGAGCDEEALRATKKLPFVPAMDNNGRPVYAFITLVVEFSLPQ